jgi:hypothetical protein
MDLLISTLADNYGIIAAVAFICWGIAMYRSALGSR